MKHQDITLLGHRSTLSADDEIDLGAFVATLWRGKGWIGFLCVLSLCVGGFYALYIATPIYTTMSSVALESRQEQIVDIESVMTGLSGDQITINTEVEVLRSRRLIRKLVADLDLVSDPEFNPQLREKPLFSVGRIRRLLREAVSGTPVAEPIATDAAIENAVISAVLGNITVSNVRQSYVFNIAVATQDAMKSADIANRLAELYVADQIALKFEKTAEATAWLTARVADLQIELEESEGRLKSFSSNTDLISPEGLIGLNRQLKDLRDRQSVLQETVTLHIERLSLLTAADATGNVKQMAEAAQDPTLDRLAASSSEQAFRDGFNAMLQRAQMAHDRTGAQLAALDQSIFEITQNIATQSDELVALQQLQREAEASGLIYEFFLSRLKETSVQQGLQQAESRILSYAVVPNAPSAPRVALILVLSLVFGVSVGAALVLLRELRQNTFRTADSLEGKTGFPVIGQIPLIPARNRKKTLGYLLDKPNSQAAEAVRSLRTSLLLANLDNPPRVIMSTSSVPAEGKTTNSIALAMNLAGLGEKVLLIEGDIRRRVMNTYFDIPDKPGFLSVMLGNTLLEDALTPLPDLNIDVLFGEKSQTNAADIFSSNRFGDFLRSLREHYDYVIIDTPPVLAVADARIIAQWVDTTLYTVRWDRTSHRDVLEGLRALQQVQIKLAGLVLGQISMRGMQRYGYGKGSDSYGNYYDM